MKKLFLIICVCAAAWCTATAHQPRHRLIVLTDVENEPDDNQSLVRLMLYSNQIDIEAIVATTSTHMRGKIAPETIEKVMRAYGEARPNLLAHEEGWPTEQEMLARIKRGIAKYGMEGVGPGCDSEGSQAIVDAVLSDDSRPLWVTAWGGPNVLAQALWRIRHDYPAEQADRLVSKLRVYAISDQDDSGPWMRREFPSLFYIVSPGGYGNSIWSSITNYIDGADNETISNDWIAANIQQGHGPLGACYPDVSYGMEGDTPSWLNLIPNGLSDPEHPEWGGWGGRYELYIPEYETLDLNGFTGGVAIEPETRPIWTNGVDSVYAYEPARWGRSVARSKEAKGGYGATLWRWRADMQHDFAGRMDWCVSPEYGMANHAPVVKLAHPADVYATAGDWITLDASDSYDPDGDSLSYLWINYPEAGTYKEWAHPSSAENMHTVAIHLPEVDKPETIHYILRLSDKAEQPMVSYARVIIHVDPRR